MAASIGRDADDRQDGPGPARSGEGTRGALSTDTEPTAARGSVTIDAAGIEDGTRVEMTQYLRTIGPVGRYMST